MAENFQLSQGLELNQGRISAISQVVRETFSVPVQQLLAYLERATQQVLARIESVKQAGVMRTVSDSANAIQTLVDGVPGGHVVLTATGIAAAAVGSPVAISIGVAATGIQMVANNAPTIQMGAQAIQNVVTNLSSGNSSTGNESNTTATVESPSMLYQFGSYMGSAADSVVNAGASAVAILDYQLHRVTNRFTPQEPQESNHSSKLKRA